MSQRVLKVHQDDNVIVALADLQPDEMVALNGAQWKVLERIPAKHKFAAEDLEAGAPIYMYGVLVGKAQSLIKKGGIISTGNVKHAANDFTVGDRKTNWNQPDVS